MTDTLAHRGPDDQDYWVAGDGGIALGFRRLAIQDLSPNGKQPMHSRNGRYVIVFNGEIYNFLELKKELEGKGCTFRGGSDTEVMLAAFETWDIPGALRKFTGMFAFALWDKQNRQLTLARDRLGEKPLYYGWQNHSFLFGSELKALRVHHAWKHELDRCAVVLLLRHNYIPAPYSIFRDIRKLMPGTYLTVDAGSGKTTNHTYWSAGEVFAGGIRKPLTEKPDEIAEMLETKIRTSIRRQMIADVPIGAFLSGGVDSSTIVSIMQSESTQPVRTFTIGFNEPEYNEAGHAKEISRILGTDHTEYILTENQAMDVIPDLPYIYDEPFADSSQIPTFLVSRITRNDVTVSLSGDAGDELFCGYPRYYHMLDYWRRVRSRPRTFRRMSAGMIKGIPKKVLDRVAGPLLKSMTSRDHHNAGERLHNMADGWLLDSPILSYQHQISYWKNADVVLGGREPAYTYNDNGLLLDHCPLLRQLQYLDILCYLPDDILCKVDRAAMANSLETRIPLLDHDIVEFAARIPHDVNSLHADGKWPLRRILRKFNPDDLIERPKMGFAIPIGTWLRGPLRDWAEALLDNKRLEHEEVYRAGYIRDKWTAHLNGDTDNSFYLWSILMYEAWAERWN